MRFSDGGSAAVEQQPLEPARLVAPRREVPLHIPTRPEGLAAHYDITLSRPLAEAARFAAFERYLAAAAADQGLSCGLLHDDVIAEAVRRLAQGRLRIGFHLDYFALWHVSDNPYLHLTLAIQDAGGRPVNAPARARAFTDKAAAHAELLRHGLGVPPTILVRPWLADRPLAHSDRDLLRLDQPGTRLFIKPANGFGGHGVVRLDRTDDDAFPAALAAARSHDASDTYLVQREVRPPSLLSEDGPRPAYWRLLHCFGEWTVCWWQPHDPAAPKPSYRVMTPEEMRRHRLQPVLAYARELAHLTGLNWFSTELCLGDGPDPSRFSVTGSDGRERPVLAIDYLNDQCDVDVQSRWPGAPPDDVIQRVAERFAEEAWQVRQEAIRPSAGLAWRLAA
jgi:hypothetical protein